MIAREFDAITKDDIEALVTSAVSEGRTIEYKEQLPGGTDDDKREFLADASSFANAGGGDLLYGIREKRDVNSRPTGIPEIAEGLASINPDAEIRRLEDILRHGIDPRIPGVRIRHVGGFAAGPVLVLRIPRSWASPHMVIFKNVSRFFSRTSAGKHQLDVREIRAAFIASQGLLDRIKNIRNERLSRIIADETPVRLPPKARLIIHLIPLASSQLSTPIDLSQLLERPNIVPPLQAYGHTHRINFDGFLTHTPEQQGPLSYTYLQIFRTGMFEAVNASLLTQADGSKLIQSAELEREMLKGLQTYMAAAKDLGIPLPFVVLVTLHGVKGLTLARNSPWPVFVNVESIDRETLLLPEVIIEDFTTPVDVILRPVLDAIWQAGGLPACQHYTPQGRWDAGRSHWAR